MTINESNPLNQEFAKNAANLTCPILRNNYEKLTRSDFYKQYADSFLSHAPSEAFQEMLSNEKLIRGSLIDCYPDITKELEDIYNITPEKSAAYAEFLEGLATMYVALSTQTRAREDVGRVLDLMSKLVEDLDKVTLGWDECLDIFETMFMSFSSDKKKSKQYSEAFKSLIKARNELRTLPNFIKNSQTAKMVEHGKRAQPANIGLQFWIESIYWLWVVGLGRSIENKNDGINGRKHLLNFMEALMLPLHEAVEFSTLDNMLRKVQEDVKARGGFNHPNFELGASSPLRVGWSKSES